jgi:glyoxylase-like metal-dependent hydrolase (beta-lactamase superfamily II)
MKYRIRPLALTVQEAPMSSMTYLSNWDETVNVTGYIWYVEGGSKNIIVDTGGSAEGLSMLGFPAREVNTPEEALGKLGLKCGDIDTIIATHLMFDHIEFAREFENAKIIAQEDEIKYALNPHPFTGIFYWRVQELVRELRDQQRFEMVKGDAQVEEGIRVLLTPGHSPGGQSVAIDTDKGVAIITGFCCIDRNFEEWAVPVAPCGIHVNAEQSYDSIVRVKEMADMVLPLHEPRFSGIDHIP